VLGEQSLHEDSSTNSMLPFLDGRSQPDRGVGAAEVVGDIRSI
jgi:hypothetical protein